MPINSKEITVLLPIQGIAPSSWTATWDEDTGYVFEESYSEEMLRGMPGVMDATLQLAEAMGLDAERVSDATLRIKVEDPANGLGSMLTEVALQMEVRGIIVDGGYLRIVQAFLKELAPPPLPVIPRWALPQRADSVSQETEASEN